MPHKRDLSIFIKNREGKRVVWTPSDPLPVESTFLPLNTTVRSDQARRLKPKRIRVLQRIKMFIKTKAKKIHGTRAVNTGHNHGTISPSENPTIMHRFKNLLIHTSKPSVEMSSSTTAHEGRPAPRGRQASWTSACRGCRAHVASAIPHDPAVCRFQEQDSPTDALPLTSPRRGAISHTLEGAVSSQRIQTATEIAEDLMSRSTVRSPSMVPIFRDDVSACDNQQDGNVGQSDNYFANIRTSSFGSDGSEVNVSIDRFQDRQFYFAGRHNTSNTAVSDAQSTLRTDYLESESISPFTIIKEPDRRSFENFQSQTPKADNSRGQSIPTSITPKNGNDEPLPFFLGLPPSLRSTTPTQPPSDLTANLEEAMNSNLASSTKIAPAQQPRSVSSIYSSTHSSDLFIPRQHDLPHEPSDPIKAYMEREFSNSPSSPIIQKTAFIIERGIEPSNVDQQPSLPLSKSQSSVSIPTLSPPRKSFTIERGHLEEPNSQPSLSSPIRSPSSPPLPPKSPARPQGIPIPILTSKPIKNTLEPEIIDMSILSLGSSYMEISPPQRPTLVTTSPRTSEEFEMISSVETIPAELDGGGVERRKSRGPMMPGRWPSVSSSMYSGWEGA